MEAGVQRRSLAAPAAVEWPTLALALGVHAAWAAVLWGLAPLSQAGAAAALAVVLALHSSLQHEVLHGHPFADPRANEALVWLPLGLLIPYRRFRDTHLAHHRDERLTDPYDDPESNFLDPDLWARLPAWRRLLREANNTLAGRMLLGPAISQWVLMRDDARAVLRGERAVLGAWLHHLAGLVPVLAAILAAPIALPAYLAGCYGALSILKIRTFLEHRAHEAPRARTVVIERGGVLGFLFLNNHLHIVHHMHPRVPWYRLPALWRAERARFLAANHGYAFRSYGEVLRRYLWRRKDPVPHPIWRGRGGWRPFAARR